MSLFRYTAIRRSAVSALDTSKTGAATTSATLPLKGEIAGESGADVRAQLRRAGLQVIDLELLRETARRGAHGQGLSQTVGSVHPSTRNRTEEGADRGDSLRDALVSAKDRYLRSRRRAIRSEMFDALATMQDGGMPLLQSLDAMLWTKAGKAAKRLLLAVRESVKDGASLASAFLEHPSWFDPVEIAMVEAGQRGGKLSFVLRNLADRHERGGALLQKLMGALAYPSIVFTLGLLVVAFLSTRTLPELVAILNNAKIEPPALTLHVIDVGSFLASAWWSIPVGALVSIGLALVVSRRSRGEGALRSRLDRLRPELLRKLLVGRASSTLAELVKTGVPLVEALRVLAPTSGSASLSKALLASADALERGETLSTAFERDAWFDEEFLRLLEIGQTTGELPALLLRIGARYERSASRGIDRLASLLEPASILLLASLVGTVALAAVLPLFKLQEVL